MEFAVIWFTLAVVVGIAAAIRGKSGLGYFLLAVVLSPVIGVVLLALTPSKAADADAKQPRVRCPECAELVLADALKCKHCGADLSVAKAERDGERRKEIEARRSGAEAVGRGLARLIRRK